MNKITLPFIIVAALLGGYLLSGALTPKELSLQTATWLKKPKVLPKVQLIDHNGKAFTKQQLLGKWTLMFFGYTNCPDVCPDSLNRLKTMMEHLKPEVAKDIQVVFISIDPWRDTPEKLKKYVAYFNKDFIGASADMPELTPLTNALGIIHYTRKRANSDEYDVAHSGTMTLINPQAEFNAVFSPPHDAVKMASDLTNIRNFYL